jgi:hypothetical protein
MNISLAVFSVRHIYFDHFIECCCLFSSPSEIMSKQEWQKVARSSDRTAMMTLHHVSRKEIRRLSACCAKAPAGLGRPRGSNLQKIASAPVQAIEGPARHCEHARPSGANAAN